MGVILEFQNKVPVSYKQLLPLLKESYPDIETWNVEKPPIKFIHPYSRASARKDVPYTPPCVTIRDSMDFPQKVCGEMYQATSIDTRYLNTDEWFVLFDGDDFEYTEKTDVAKFFQRLKLPNDPVGWTDHR